MMFLLIILYLVNFIRTIFIIAIIIMAMRIIVRYVFPLIINKGVKNMQEKMQNRQRQQQRTEGEVTIESQQQKQGTNSNDKGEYVDFEEVE